MMYLNKPAHHGLCVEVTGQLHGAGSLLPPLHGFPVSFEGP